VTCKPELLQRAGLVQAVRRGPQAARALPRRALGRRGGGNHGIALADAAAVLGVAATVVMPESTPQRSIAAVRSRGAELRLTPDVSAAFALLDELVAAGRTLVHPSTTRSSSPVRAPSGWSSRRTSPTCRVSIGGGAPISGVATALHALLPGVRVWGVETDGADSMSRALAAGTPVTMAPTSIVTTLAPPMSRS
jgi:threonine dehydratase